MVKITYICKRTGNVIATKTTTSEVAEKEKKKFDGRIVVVRVDSL